MAFEKQSIMYNSMLHLDGGGLVAKSRAIWNQGLLGTGSGQKKPAGGWEEVFPLVGMAGRNILLHILQ